MKFFKSIQCPRCPEAEKNLKEIIRSLNIQKNIEIFDISTDEGRIEALANMVMSSPALVINEEIIPEEVLLDKKMLADTLKKLVI